MKQAYCLIGQQELTFVYPDGRTEVVKMTFENAPALIPFLKRECKRRGVIMVWDKSCTQQPMAGPRYLYQFLGYPPSAAERGWVQTKRKSR